MTREFDTSCGCSCIYCSTDCQDIHGHAGKHYCNYHLYHDPVQELNDLLAAVRDNPPQSQPWKESPSGHYSGPLPEFLKDVKPKEGYYIHHLKGSSAPKLYKARKVDDSDKTVISLESRVTKIEKYLKFQDPSWEWFTK